MVDVFAKEGNEKSCVLELNPTITGFGVWGEDVKLALAVVVLLMGLVDGCYIKYLSCIRWIGFVCVCIIMNLC